MPPRGTHCDVTVVTEAMLGSHRAHAINVFKTAGGFRRLGLEVVVLCRGVEPGMTADEALAWYGEPWLRVETGGHDLPSEEFGLHAARRTAELGARVLYARQFFAPLRAAEIGMDAVLETHAYIGDPNPALGEAFAHTRRSSRPLNAIATIAPSLASHFIERGARPDKVHVIPDGVDIHLFSRPEQIGPSPYPAGDEPNVTYAGHLYDHKGIPNILEAAALMPDACFHLLGGAEDDIERVRKQRDERRLSNLTLHGRVEHAQVPRYLWHADALLLPPRSDEPSARWTSPVKLGEYLASGTPTVASRIEGLTNWVDEPAVRWFDPNSASDLCRQIRATLEMTPDQRDEQRAGALHLAHTYRYEARAAALWQAATGTPLAPQMVAPKQPLGRYDLRRA